MPISRISHWTPGRGQARQIPEMRTTAHSCKSCMVQVLTREPRKPSSNHSIERLFSLIAPTRAPGFLFVELRGPLDSHQSKHSLEFVTEPKTRPNAFYKFLSLIIIHVSTVTDASRFPIPYAQQVQVESSRICVPYEVVVVPGPQPSQCQPLAHWPK